MSRSFRRRLAIPRQPAGRRRVHRRARLLGAAVAALGLLALAAPLGQAAGAARSDAPAVAPERVTAQILATHVVYTTPSLTGRRVGTIKAHRPITGERTVLPVDAQRTSANGTRWLKVMLPGRPDGHTGWIRAHGTQRAVTAWHLVVDLAARTVTVYLDGVRQRTFRAVVGKSSTPTPTGHYFVEETVKMPADDPGGPYALALSARSNVLQQFDGGPGQIGIHGRDGLGGTLGQAQSHGCVRLADTAVTWLAQRIGPGVPVDIDAR